MNSVQENKNELEAAVRYCESAISRAKATIESMEFRQEMAKKEYQERTGREQALEEQNNHLHKEVTRLENERRKLYEDKERLTALEIQLRDRIHELKNGKATMPVIPRDVAIAIFREGIQTGVNSACAEIEGERINIDESEYVGDFSITFERDIDLDDHIDFDWVRGKCGDYTEDAVIDSLKGLCADKKFECRIHGVDDDNQ